MWPASLRGEVLDRIPRLALGTELLRCFDEQARRKPDSSAAAAVRSGVADRIRANPLEREITPQGVPGGT